MAEENPVKDFEVRGGSFSNVTADVQKRQSLNAGEFVVEVADPGGATTRAKVCVTSEIVAKDSAIVWRCRPLGLKDDGTEDDYSLQPAEHTFHLGLSDGDPEAVLEDYLKAEALRAHRARKQLDIIRAMGLPEPASAEPDDE